MTEDRPYVVAEVHEGPMDYAVRHGDRDVKQFHGPSAWMRATTLANLLNDELAARAERTYEDWGVRHRSEGAETVEVRDDRQHAQEWIVGGFFGPSAELVCRTVFVGPWRPAPPDTAAAPAEGKPQPCADGFHWVGQSFDTCERCGLPAWEHAGEARLADGSPFTDGGFVLRPWEPGEADAIRRKWDPSYEGERNQ
ncbi:hypothetical protein [Amycolatopsis thermophila]|uniref:Uncharacterized protein n=1 Tax=Amycolatopsis thermophila TaxID=206084 RepID=A0ABU0ENG2_9PSEU|nr:hypothetical protein [Amycolatopsis thermophila]MDQ0376540.1 hypothetical protein [Amycolatopsis thermophila]